MNGRAMTKWAIWLEFEMVQNMNQQITKYFYHFHVALINVAFNVSIHGICSNLNAS